MRKGFRIGLLFLILLVVLCGSLEYSAVLKWESVLGGDAAPSYAEIEHKFGKPREDIGSGIHIFVFRTFIGKVAVGTADADSVLYIKWLFPIWGRDLYLAPPVG